MKTLFLLLLSAITIYTSSAQSMSRNQLRAYYLRSLNSRSSLDTFNALLKAIQSRTPLEESYYGICQGMQAQYAEGMWSKLRLVNSSRGCLNKAVEQDSRDPELRFMRFTLEHYLPSFLGMSSHLNSDLTYILDHSEFVDDNADLKVKVLEFIVKTKRCSIAQVQVIKNKLSGLKGQLAEQTSH